MKVNNKKQLLEYAISIKTYEDLFDVDSLLEHCNYERIYKMDCMIAELQEDGLIEWYSTNQYRITKKGLHYKRHQFKNIAIYLLKWLRNIIGLIGTTYLLPLVWDKVSQVIDLLKSLLCKK